jgi:hypothetical protein
VYEHDGQVGVVYFAISKVPEKWLEPLWEIYDESLHMSESIQEQSCYNHNSFISALIDPEYIKGLLVVDDEPVGLMMGALTLEKATVAYINPAFVRQQFPKEIEEGRFCYITTFFISSRLRNLGFVKLMCGALFTAIHDKNLLLGGDLTDTRLYLADFVEKISEEVGFPIKKRLLGTQSYFAFECMPATGAPKPEGINDIISQVQS